jgi:predicted protein tyrosine phosphatase
MFDLTLARPTAAAPRDAHFIATTCSANDHERCALLLVACVTGLSVVSAAMLLFVDDGNARWLDMSAGPAIATQRCDAIANGLQRHECQREAVQATERRASSPTVLVQH